MICRFYLPQMTRQFIIGFRRSSSSTISTVHQILDYDISDALVNRTELFQVKKKKVKPGTQRKILKDKFKDLFSFSEEEASKLSVTNQVTWKIPLPKISANIECLHGKNVKAQSIVDNLWLLGVPTKYLEEKLELIERLQPRDINDFIPLIRVSAPVLKRTGVIVQQERCSVPEQNRIYFLSKRFRVEPAVVSKYIAAGMFMFEIPFKDLETNLDMMLKKSSNPVTILHNLRIFKNPPASIEAEFVRFQKENKKLKPLLFNCPEDLFVNSVEDTNNVALDNTVVEYVGKRLGYNTETTRILMAGDLMKVRLPKVKEVLDYLLIEEGFKPLEVASTIRILSRSINTIKDRINNIKKHGLRPMSLSIVCRSQSEFDKYLQRLIERNKEL